jgi:hypothetical protein
VVVLCVFPMVLDWWLVGVWIACVVRVRVYVYVRVCGLFCWYGLTNVEVVLMYASSAVIRHPLSGSGSNMFRHPKAISNINKEKEI